MINLCDHIKATMSTKPPIGLSALKQQILSSGDDLMKPGSSLQGGSEKEVQTALFGQQLYFCGSFLLTQKDHG